MDASLKKAVRLADALESCQDRQEDFLAWEAERLSKRIPAVSGWSVAQQIHHTAVATTTMLLAIDRIAKRKSPAHEGGRVNLIGRVILRAGRMPRGRAQAPGRTRPPDEVSPGDVAVAVEHTRASLESVRAQLEEAVSGGWKADHPYLGPLDTAQWLRVAAIHADHHFRIIAEIDRA